jgi:hypothetical protein
MIRSNYHVDVIRRLVGNGNMPGNQYGNMGNSKNYERSTEKLHITNNHNKRELTERAGN